MKVFLVLVLCVFSAASFAQEGEGCQEIVSLSGAEFYLDGGSFKVDGLNRCKQDFALKINNSLERERNVGFPEIVLNGAEVQRDSVSESRLLGVLDRAVVRRISPLSVKRFKKRMTARFDDETKNTAVLVAAVEHICLRRQRGSSNQVCAKYLM